MGSYLDPLLLAKISALQLRAKTVVEGFIAGLHKSPTHGHSLEFVQHREYTFGDELKYLDWKVYGKTDRFFIKQFEAETNLRLYLLLDASGSMNFKGEKSALSKYETAATLAASLGYLALKQGDSVGLAAFNKGTLRLIPPRNSLSHLNILVKELEGVSVQGETSLSEALEEIAQSSKKRSLFILISDLIEDENALLAAIKLLRFKKHEVSVVQLLDPEEKEFPFQGNIRLESLEKNENLNLNSELFRADYQKAIENFILFYQKAFRDIGVEHHFVLTSQPLELTLSAIVRAA
ncbi:MAG: hypothetical protein A3I11_07455 [Elusimicrobia bacterium RIFCSPLOWO2_02_FULL_39_32]|nr:MAG: hypothetical protein A2034_01905 [Elusimicrobia bacterium GWA2_38_7]OGR81412.1 MAG: hypothetical protein A3B80_05170 [Elusimicrobia bacterium RIFCSPHIGHO2_02_FULL_39_36]OGR92021.1 MAG: hypothetical protein A3I11_07455 [Elusimicrobia bacterium RIFCSPLOWO2_02_FULL_39_32]OGR98688.1 MAG: hypothetical protein A3G85_04975 [Elusimicrobia bacterium RIFCSPLOWO2_12_FULL_39_28]